jgi:tetratricopeptide (TPR) repeat protein
MSHGEDFRDNMKRGFIVLVLCSTCAIAQAMEYGHYDVKSVVSISETTPGNPSVTINVAYFVQILNDLGSHAGTWPVHFDSADDQHRAEHDVVSLSALLDPFADSFNTKALLLRLALLHAVGHNLDIPGADEKAVAVFNKVLQLWPNDLQANYRYGVFLAGTTKFRNEAIPLLEKAKALGVVDAEYTLGHTYLSLGDKVKAVENLKSYTTRVPNDENAARALDAVSNDKVEGKQLKPSP